MYNGPIKIDGGFYSCHEQMYRARPMAESSKFHKLAFLQENANGNLEAMKRLYRNPFGLVSRGKNADCLFDMLVMAFGDITEHTTTSSIAWIHAQIECYLTDPENRGIQNKMWLKQRIQGAFRSAIHQNRFDLVLFLWNLALSGGFLSGPEADQEAADLLRQNDYRCFTDACASGNLDIIEFLYDTAYIHRCFIPHERMESCWRSACIEGRLEIAKWLYNKSASLGLELEVPANYSPLVEEWVGGKRIEQEWILVEEASSIK